MVVLGSFAFGFLSAFIPRLRDFEQGLSVLGFHAFRQPPTLLCISSEFFNILHQNGLCVVPLMEQRPPQARRSASSQDGDGRDRWNNIRREALAAFALQY